MLDKRENIALNCAEHSIRLELLEVMPTQGLPGHILVGLGVVPVAERECGIIEFAKVEFLRNLLALSLGIVEKFHKEQVSHLFENRHRVGDTCTFPESVPNLVYLVFNLSCNHSTML